MIAYGFRDDNKLLLICSKITGNLLNHIFMINFKTRVGSKTDFAVSLNWLQAWLCFTYCTFYTRYFEVSFFSTRSCVPGAGLAGRDAVSDRLYRRGEGPDRESLPRYQAPRPPSGTSQKSLLILWINFSCWRLYFRIYKWWSGWLQLII